MKFKEFLKEEEFLSNEGFRDGLNKIVNRIGKFNKPRPSLNNNDNNNDHLRRSFDDQVRMIYRKVTSGASFDEINRFAQENNIPNQILNYVVKKINNRLKPKSPVSLTISPDDPQLLDPLSS